jgi:hypothetical protein
LRVEAQDLPLARLVVGALADVDEEFNWCFHAPSIAKYTCLGKYKYREDCLQFLG